MSVSVVKIYIFYYLQKKIKILSLAEIKFKDIREAAKKKFPPIIIAQPLRE